MTSIAQITAIESVKMILAVRNGSERECEDDGSERHSTAKNAPVERSPFAGLRLDQQNADHRNGWNDQSQQKDNLAIEDARQPAGKSGHCQYSGRQRQATNHLHHAELGAHVLFRPRVSDCVTAGDDLGRHRLRNHVLNHGTNHDQHRAENIEIIHADKRDPSPGRASEGQHATRGQRRADQHIGRSLRAKDGHAVYQLAEHHLDCPWQAQPHANSGKLGRIQGQSLLDPHVATEVDDPQCAIGEKDHDQRQIGQVKPVDRSQ
jgi:hypothetical protein